MARIIKKWNSFVLFYFSEYVIACIFNHKEIFGQFSSIFVTFLLTTAWDMLRSTSGKHQGENPKLLFKKVL